MVLLATVWPRFERAPRIRVYPHLGFDCAIPTTSSLISAMTFCQEFPAKRLTLYRETTSLVVCETKLPPAKPSFEDFVLLEQVDDSGLLVTLEPSSDGDDQQGQGLDRRAHDRGF